MKLFDRARSITSRTSRPMSRDKADTLLLMLACILVLAPHTAHLPLWITGVNIALLAWRSWITFRGNRMPPRWLLLPIAALAMGGVYLTFNTIFGRDAGVAMLVLLLTFKLLEMRANRDLFVVVFLSFFLILTNFFYSQSIATALMMMAAVIVMLTAQLSFQYTGTMPPFGKRLRTGAMIFALAAPLTIVLFVLFPRIQGPLWGMPGDANAGRSGLSDNMAPGNIAELALSDEVAFRVKFLDPVPSHAKLYWRGIVLAHFDGRTWTRQASRQSRTTQTALMINTPVRYQVTQEAGSRPWLFALDLPQAAPQLPGNPVMLTTDMQLVSQHPIDARVRYDVTSYLGYSLQPAISAGELQDALALPLGYNPMTIRFAAGMHNRFPDDRARIDAVLAFFGSREYNFSYTLAPPLLGRNSADEFLFRTRAGFCEHYASAFVILMRAMGIPARVVTGYQGGEINPVDGFLTVRQSDAHAWAEVWQANLGWIRIDPTAAVAPNRIERNIAVAAPNQSVLGGLFNIDTGRDSLVAKLRFRWDAVNNGWNQWVLNYTPTKQKDLLRTLGFGNINWQTMLLMMFAVCALVMLAIAVPLLRNRSKIDPVDALYAALCKQMARLGYPRRPHEGPRAYSVRLLASASALTPERKRSVKKFLTLYETARYADPASTARSNLLSTLKSLLNRIK